MKDYDKYTPLFLITFLGVDDLLNKQWVNNYELLEGNL